MNLKILKLVIMMENILSKVRIKIKEYINGRIVVNMLVIL